jgi:hypothetical protein
MIMMMMIMMVMIMMMIVMMMMTSVHVLAAIRHLSDGMGEQTRLRYR